MRICFWFNYAKKKRKKEKRRKLCKYFITAMNNFNNKLYVKRTKKEKKIVFFFVKLSIKEKYIYTFIFHNIKIHQYNYNSFTFNSWLYIVHGKKKFHYEKFKIILHKKIFKK